MKKQLFLKLKKYEDKARDTYVKQSTIKPKSPVLTQSIEFENDSDSQDEDFDYLSKLF